MAFCWRDSGPITIIYELVLTFLPRNTCIKFIYIYRYMYISIFTVTACTDIHIYIYIHMVHIF